MCFKVLRLHSRYVIIELSYHCSSTILCHLFHWSCFLSVASLFTLHYSGVKLPLELYNTLSFIHVVILRQPQHDAFHFILELNYH